MGGGASTANPYKSLKGAVDGDDKWATFCEFFGLEPSELEAFFKAWRKMDTKATGAICFSDYARVWSVSEFGDDNEEEKEINKRFFCLLDKDSDPGEEPILYFQEWAVRTFGFGTLDLDGLVRWTFEMFDRSGEGSINLEEFMDMVKLCLGPSAVEDRKSRAYMKTEKIRRYLDASRDGKIKLSEFRRAEAVCAELFAPLMRLQRCVHERILGEAWWKAATKARKQKLQFTIVEASKGEKIPWTIYNTGGTYQPWRGGRVPEGTAEIAEGNAARIKAAARAKREAEQTGTGIHKYDGDFKAISEKYQKNYFYEPVED